MLEKKLWLERSNLISYAGSTSILGQQFNGVGQFKDLFQRVMCTLLALQDNKSKQKWQK